MSIGLLGKKLGMTRLYDEKGRLTTATVIEASGNRILQVKSAEKDGYQCGAGGLMAIRSLSAWAKRRQVISQRPLRPQKNSFASFDLRDDESAPENTEVSHSRCSKLGSSWMSSASRRARAFKAS